CLWGFYAIFSAVILGLTGVRAWKGNVYSPGNLHLFATLLLTVTILTALAWIPLKRQLLCVMVPDGELTLRWPLACYSSYLPAASYTTSITQRGRGPTNTF